MNDMNEISGMEIFRIDAVKLAELFSGLKCEACGRALEPVAGETWAKVGCGTFCPDCIALDRHLTHPSACRVPVQ